MGFPSRSICIALPQSDQLLHQPLRFFGFGPCGGDCLAFGERSDEVAEKSYTVRGFALEVSVKTVASGAHREISGDYSSSYGYPHTEVCESSVAGGTK